MTQGIGLGLSERLYHAVVAPVMRRHFPALPYAAGRIGLGSEVLGYDTAMSADHDYGPCLQIFLRDSDFGLADELLSHLDGAMPETFEGWATRYPTHTRPPGIGARRHGMLGSHHGVEIYTLGAWCDHFIGRRFDDALTPRDWLSYSEQIFLTMTAGAVFHDGVGELTDLRRKLAYFPGDIWLYKLASQWSRIAEERTYVGRTGNLGDEIGSRVVAARIVGNLMRLAMLVERRYAPYHKWMGTAFASLPCAPGLSPLMVDVLSAQNWRDREESVLVACRFLADLQLERDVPGASPPVVVSIHDRPFRFVDSVKICEGIRAAIEDEALRNLPEFGGADQFLGSNFVLAVPDYSRTAVTALIDHATNRDTQ